MEESYDLTHVFSHPGECQMYTEERDMTKASRHTFGYSSPSATCSLLGIQQLEFILGINYVQILFRLPHSGRSFQVHAKGQSHPSGAMLELNHSFSELVASEPGNHHAVLAGNTRGHTAEGEKPDKGL